MRYIFLVTVLPLDQLYADANNDSDIVEMRWKILAFIMSLSDKNIQAIKKLPKNFALVSVTLYALVKVKFLWIKTYIHVSPSMISFDRMD